MNWNTLDKWWFGRVRPETLGLLRIVMGWMAIVELSLFAFNYQHFYTDSGILPRSVAHRFLWYPMKEIWPSLPLKFEVPFQPARFSLIELFPDPRFVVGLYALTMIAALCFMLGFKTRIASVLLVLGVVSFHIRNPMIIHSGDTLLRLILIYLMFARCDKAYSIDRMLALKAGKITGEPELVWAFPQRLIHFQLMIVYGTTFYWKLFGHTWWDGTATWFGANLMEFKRFPLPEFASRQPFVMLETYATMVFWFTLAFLTFNKKTRRFAVVCGVFAHGFIDYAFNIPMYSWVITTAYLSFYEGEEIKAMVQRVGKRFGWIKDQPAPEPAPA